MEVGVEGIVHAIVAAGRQTIVETKRPGAVLSGDAQRGLNRVGINYGLPAGGDDRMNNAFNANLRYSF